MAQTSRFWDGLSTGDASVAPYDASSEFAAVLMALSRSNAQGNASGVCRGARSDTGLTILSDLAVSGTSSPVTTGTGKAFVNGTWYENTTAITTTIASPASSTRIDRLVLRKSWGAQTVRLALVAGVEGGSAPAITQTYGTTWEMPLASISITTGGVITVTDEREWIGSGIIYQATLKAVAASIDITGIPAFYDHLELTLLGRTNSGTGDYDTIGVRFNNASGAVYDYTYDVWLSTGGAQAGLAQAQTSILAGYCANSNNATGVFGNFNLVVPRYASTGTRFKVCRSEGGTANTSASVRGSIFKMQAQWESTAAINRITLTPGSAGDFVVDTYVQLRGIPA